MRSAFPRRPIGLTTLVVGLLLLVPIAGRASAPPPREARPSGGRALDDVLRPDGSLDLSRGVRGSFDARGWKVRLAPGGEPTFVRAPAREAGPAAAGDDRFDAQFSSPGADDFFVRAVAVSGGRVYVGGSFRAIGKAAANNVAMWDGARWTTLGDGPENGTAGPNGGTVYSLTVDGNDLYVGGSFATAGGVRARNVARWDGAAWSALGDGDENGVAGEFGGGIVYAIAVTATDVYVGGSLSQAGRTAVGSFARFDRAAQTWSAAGGGVSPALEDDLAYVFKIAVSGQDLYVAGKFDLAGGAAAANIARFTPASGAWSPLGSGTDNWVTALAVDGGRVYAGGFFQTAGGAPAAGVAAWDGKGWAPLGAGLSTGTENLPTVHGLAVAFGRVYAAGWFAAAGGAPASSVAEWDGASWRPLAAGIRDGILDPHPATVFGIAAGPEGVYVAGAFDRAGAGPAYNVARWDVARAAWSGLVDPGVHNGVYEGNVTCLAVDGTNVYLGGGTMRVGGVLAMGVAKWDGARWSALSDGGLPGVDGLVYSIAASAGRVYVGGLFMIAGTKVARNVAAWDGAHWAGLGKGVGGSPASFVADLAVDGGSLYAAGYFSRAGGVAANNIARWDGTAWRALGAGESNGMPDGFLLSVAASGGVVYAGGYFTQAGGVPATNIARWDGSAWSALADGQSEGTDGAPLAIAISGGQVFVGGAFTTAGGRPAAALARWDAAGWHPIDGLASDSPFESPHVDALAISNGMLLVGGWFKSAGEKPANNLAVWDGSGWRSAGSGVNNTVFDVGVTRGGVYLAGSFSRAGGKPSLQVARWVP